MIISPIKILTFFFFFQSDYIEKNTVFPLPLPGCEIYNKKISDSSPGSIQCSVAARGVCLNDIYQFYFKPILQATHSFLNYSFTEGKSSLQPLLAPQQACYVSSAKYVGSTFYRQETNFVLYNSTTKRTSNAVSVASGIVQQAKCACSA